MIIVGAYKPTAAFIKTADSIGFDAVFATLSFVGSRALAAELRPLARDSAGIAGRAAVPRSKLATGGPVPRSAVDQRAGGRNRVRGA